MSKRPTPSEWVEPKTGKLTRITDTNYNLDHFVQKTENKFFGKTRLYHFEYELSTGAKRYAQFYQERLNQKTINLICNHRRGRGKRVQKCDARITLNHNLEVEKFHTEKSQKAKYKFPESVKKEQLIDISNFTFLPHSCGKVCDKRGCLFQHTCKLSEKPLDIARGVKGYARKLTEEAPTFSNTSIRIF